MNLLAQTTKSVPLGTIGGEGLGPFGAKTFTGESALATITGAVSSIIGFLTIAGGIWFMFQMFFGGYEWINSGGDTKKLTSARERITHGFFGLTIIVGSWALLAVVGQFFGYDILVTSPATIIRQIQFQAK